MPTAATPESVFKVSEIFASLQGEGPSAGRPALFVRLAVCNLRCAWCDTRYSWDFERYDYEREVFTLNIAELARRIEAEGLPRLILTGGEPLLQQRALADLLTRLPADLVIEVETNGTIAPDAALVRRVNQWNVSPKLAHSGDAAERRLRPRALAALRDAGNSVLKLVVRSAADLAEVDALTAELAWPKDRVFLMCEAQSAAEHAERAAPIAALCLERGYGFSPRLHLLLWGGERGR